ncbi:helix-turn-helix domain-containing protein [Haloterrigena sp. SYSU A558-1]|uniref:Helix-turn-helix domain-containing protein n=1 Tax=Haloterrigena gelatinilytica TaxID=2741724 RepID=A0ABX2L7V3_9EURY|nr:helix-turn-helix domain-containing protein [Haloterrigena gelatinilytica]NUC71450.1 helix-turn-helix domain-containing protein [Haloterrigena gelatinilytica]
MTARSSTASRVLVCLVTLLVCGAGTVGIVAAATGGAASLGTDDSLTGSVDETDDELANVSDDLENADDGTIDGGGNATNETADEDDGTAAERDGGTDGLRNVTDESDDSIDETEATLENGSGTVTNTTDETRDAVDAAANETADGLLENSSDALDGDAELDGSIGTESVGLEVSASASTDSSDGAGDGDDDAASAGDYGSTDGSPIPDGTSTTADVVLVGLLGTITAAGAAAGGAGAGAAAGSAGAGAGSAGAAGGATGLTANWLGQSVLRHLRRLGSLLPVKLLSILGYSRYDDSDPLENDRRRAIYETIAADPGCYLSQVSEESGVALSTVRHHVRILDEEGLVATAKVDGKRRYFLADEAAAAPGDGGPTVEDAELHAALAEPAKRAVLETLADLGSAPNGRLADELERDPSTVSHHLSALADDGLVVREKDGRAMINELVPTVEAALSETEPSLEDETASPSAPADD